MDDLNMQKWFLALDKETKLEMLESAISTGKTQEFFTLSKLVLDVPREEGGISSEEIDTIHRKYTS